MYIYYEPFLPARAESDEDCEKGVCVEGLQVLTVVLQALHEGGLDDGLPLFFLIYLYLYFFGWGGVVGGREK